MKTSHFYNLLSPFYFLIDAGLKRHKAELIHEVNLYPESTILEIGIGHGTHLKHYVQETITAIDISTKMLEQAKLNNSNKVNFVLLDASQIEQLNQNFDLIILSHVLSTSKTPNQLIEKAISALSTKGKLIILNHFSNNSKLAPFEKGIQPFAKLFHFKSYFSLKSLTALNELKQLKALKFGFLNSYQLLVFEK